MIRRSCVIRALPALLISPVRMLPIRVRHLRRGALPGRR